MKENRYISIYYLHELQFLAIFRRWISKKGCHMDAPKPINISFIEFWYPYSS